VVTYGRNATRAWNQSQNAILNIAQTTWKERALLDDVITVRKAKAALSGPEFMQLRKDHKPKPGGRAQGFSLGKMSAPPIDGGDVVKYLIGTMDANLSTLDYFASVIGHTVRCSRGGFILTCCKHEPTFTWVCHVDLNLPAREWSQWHSSRSGFMFTFARSW